MGASAPGVAARVKRVRKSAGPVLPSLIRRARRLVARAEIMVPATLAGIFLASLPGLLGALRPDIEAGIADALSRAELVASVVTQDITRLAGGEPPRAVHLDAAASRLPVGAQTPQTSLVLFDGSGAVLASIPKRPGSERHRSEILDEGQPLAIFADRAGAMRTRLADGTEVIAALRNLPHGQ